MNNVYEGEGKCSRMTPATPFRCNTFGRRHAQLGSGHSGALTFSEHLAKVECSDDVARDRSGVVFVGVMRDDVTM